MPVLLSVVLPVVVRSSVVERADGEAGVILERHGEPVIVGERVVIALLDVFNG